MEQKKETEKKKMCIYVCIDKETRRLTLWCCMMAVAFRLADIFRPGTAWKIAGFSSSSRVLLSPPKCPVHRLLTHTRTPVTAGIRDERSGRVGGYVGLNLLKFKGNYQIHQTIIRSSAKNKTTIMFLF